MAMIKCTECGKDISNLARECNGCGCEMVHIQKAINEAEAKRKANEAENRRYLDSPEYKKIMAENQKRWQAELDERDRLIKRTIAKREQLKAQERCTDCGKKISAIYKKAKKRWKEDMAFFNNKSHNVFAGCKCDDCETELRLSYVPDSSG